LKCLEGYKRLEQITLSWSYLKIPLLPWTIEQLATWYISPTQTPVLPSRNQLPGDLVFFLPSLLKEHSLPEPCITYFWIHLDVFGVPLWLLIKPVQCVEVGSFSFSSILALLNALNLTMPTYFVLFLLNSWAICALYYKLIY
jgi:hypothetical protein